MALIVEVFKSTIDLEIALMGCPDDNPFKRLYMQGAEQALKWVRDGAMKPSDVCEQSDQIAWH